MPPVRSELVYIKDFDSVPVVPLPSNYITSCVNPENTLATEAQYLDIVSQSQSSSLDRPPYQYPSLHANFPSNTVTGSSVTHPECGRPHYLKPIMTNSRYSVDFFVTMSSPAPTPGTPIEHRRENKIVLEIKIRPRSTGSDLPWDCIHIPRTKSVQRPADFACKKALEFRLEVQGATTGTIRDGLCERCTEKESRNSLRPPTLVDFASKTDTIDLKSGNAQVTFRFLCLSTHHGIADSEYR